MRTIKADVLAYFIEHQGRAVDTKELQRELGLVSTQVGQVAYVLTQSEPLLHKVKRGVWVYNPPHEVEYQQSDLVRMMELFEEKELWSSNEIAQRLGVPVSKVSSLVNRARQDIGCDLKLETSYRFGGWK